MRKTKPGQSILALYDLERGANHPETEVTTLRSLRELDSKSRDHHSSGHHRFIQTIDDNVLQKLASIAERKGITVQALIRSVIIPEWPGCREGKPSRIATSATSAVLHTSQSRSTRR